MNIFNTMHSVKNCLPPIDVMVIVAIPRGEHNVDYAFGARVIVDCGEYNGWLWGLSKYNANAKEVFNPDVETDDEYNVTHWMYLPALEE